LISVSYSLQLNILKTTNFKKDFYEVVLSHEEENENQLEHLSVLL